MNFLKKISLKKIINKKIEIKKIIKLINENYIKSCFFMAFIINYLVEIFSRHSILDPINYLFRRPIMFLFNILIIMFLLSIGAIFRKRIFYLLGASFIVLALGIINGILLIYRITPLAAVDFFLVKDLLLLINLYFKPITIAFIIIAVVGVVVGIIVLGLKAPKYIGKMYRMAVVVISIIWCLSIVGLEQIFIKAGVTTENYSNLADAYNKYGFTYCFVNSILKLGMKEPENYSPETVESIIEDKLNEKLPVVVAPDKNEVNLEEPTIDHPNIIFLQLESFFDVTVVDGLEMSNNPIPNFNRLKENFSSGFLYVPSVGAGTANTEFEVITGMNLDFFGPGEYPYKTILKTTTCESIAYNLKELGYYTHAIHNNDGTFYNRNIIFSQLGFDTFTSLEYMYDVDLNVNEFAKDEILINEIIGALNSTKKQQDLVFAISVQAHGEYPSERLGEEQPIFIRYKNQLMENQWSYFVNQLYEIDIFLGKLCNELRSRKEPTILVIYGDHLPKLGLVSEDLPNNRLTATEYIVWNNFDLDKVDKDLESYQLTSHVLDIAGIANGILTKFHQKSTDDIAYIEKLEVLQYDMLYGNLELYGGINPYIATNLKMGYKEIKINSVSNVESGLPNNEEEVWLRGNHFNKYSVVIYNGQIQETKLIDSTTLSVENISLKKGDQFVIAQIGKDKAILGLTEEYIY